ncbi:LLM class flavin-dependent oxidoreductase [Actinobacteria bacterium YIM 96077]|uniref:N5,N10-methylene tetrahydromethanopterin reductase n=2 Tax=Phytoactinopolyspora halophila TaxID=1981511 RepID=A0A329QHK3_9ACTN|nr:LLM class flavin-dependent oxidoreductase [Actinobacteria bacterium YIM 96077]RAW11854.1 N5,N10-methylene tetrahydromethanopterin reductase [Phytoactinopolyspora halophila]
MCFDRTFPASLVNEFAHRLDGRADQLWVIEDCFYTAGISLAASAAAVTDRLTVGIGILPAVARQAAVAAMEIATLCALAPGRILPGIGHGVQSWMEQMGARPASPLAALDEVMVAVRRLLHGERVTSAGRYVTLDDVQLYHPPDDVPPLLAGVRGAKSMELAGRVADGVVLAEPAAPSYVRWAYENAGQPVPFHLAVFSVLCVERDRRTAYQTMAPWLASLLDQPTPGITTLPFASEMLEHYREHGVDGLVTMPPEWWRELAPIGTMDDAMAHVRALEEAGVDSIGLWPARDVETARGQVDDVLQLAER